MILVDKSVWIDHLRNPEFALLENIESKNVLMHAMVLGELACQNIPNRSQRLSEWQGMPRAVHLCDEEVLAEIEARRLMGSGITFRGAHLLFSVLKHGDALLWTRDRRLRRIAKEFGVAFSEESRKNK